MMLCGTFFWETLMIVFSYESLFSSFQAIYLVFAAFLQFATAEHLLGKKIFSNI